MDLSRSLEAKLRRALAPRHLVIHDESALHTGHAGAAGGHFRVLIVAEAFRGKSRVERHASVYEALGDAMRSDVHAISLRTLTPEEWERVG